MSPPGPKPPNDSSSRRDWLTAPSAVFKVDPRYPPEVIRDHVEGQVVLYAIIRKDGTVDPQSIRVLQKLDPRLDVSARDALLAWKFTPSTRDGEPIDIQTEVTIPFYSHKDLFQK
jgi:protein TonB